MQEHTLDGHLARPVTIDLCLPCQSFWFDDRESLTLTPGSTLTLFRVIGEHVGPRQAAVVDTAKCPRCRARLRRTRDMQRATRFEYFKCPNGHGRLTSFFDFLREKDFIRPLTPQQIAELRRSVQTVNCSNCGGPVDLSHGASCEHCGSPLSMLDMKQAEALITQLQSAANTNARVDPTLPLQLERARREVDLAFRGLPRDAAWLEDVSSFGLVGAGLSLFARWFRHDS
jgi:hypothetical protein